MIASHDPTSARIADRAVSIQTDESVRRRAPAISGTSRSWSAGVVGCACRKICLLGAGISTRAVATLVEQGITISGKGEPDPPSMSRDGGNGRGSSTRRSSFGTVAVLSGVSKPRGMSPTPVFEGLDARFEAGVLHAII